MSETAYDEIAEKLQKEIHPQIDEFIIQSIVELFKEGILELAYKPPKCAKAEFPYTSVDPDEYTVHCSQNIWLRYVGDEKIDQLKKENEKLRENAKNAVNTTWRFINSYEKNNGVSTVLALKSAKYHLRKIDYIFEEDHISL